jgi:hypothetical protein
MNSDDTNSSKAHSIMLRLLANYKKNGNEEGEYEINYLNK